MLNTATVEREARAPQPLKDPPNLSGGLPILGHTLSFVRDLMGLLHTARAECGDVAGIKVLGRRIVLVTGVEGQQEVFRAPDSLFSPKAAYKLMVPVFGKGVAYDCPDDRMNEQLQMLMPALRHKRMKSYGEVIVDEVEKAIAKWGDEGVVPLVDFFATLTNFTSSRCLLGKEFRGEMNEEFGRVYYDLERGIVPISYINPYLPIPAFRRRDRARARLGEMVTEIVERRRKSGQHHEDFLQTLMEATYKDGSSLTEHEITGMLVAAMFAGHHTSSVTTAWCIIELLRHPDWMEKVKAELARVYGDGTVSIDHNSLRDLSVTEWVVKEVLRLHPPLFILVRVAMEDTEICGYRIPKGTWVALSPAVAHQIPTVFKNPGQFCPARFGPPDEEDKQPFAYLSFGAGRHKCLGNAFAILQIKTILAILLQRYEFELYGDPIEPDFQGLVIGPKPPARCRYRRIKAEA